MVFKGRLIKCFDGKMADENGEAKEYQPSLTIVDREKSVFYKIKVDKPTYDKYSVMMGKEIEVEGIEEKPAQPAVIQAFEIKEAKAK